MPEASEPDAASEADAESDAEAQTTSDPEAEPEAEPELESEPAPAPRTRRGRRRIAALRDAVVRSYDGRTRPPVASPDSPSAPEPDLPALPQGRADTVALATREWQETLSAMGGESALRDIETLADATLDLSAAHPGGMAQFLAGRPTTLGLLVREPSALAHARRRARAVLTRAAEHHHRYGVTATTAALGVLTWSDPVGDDAADGSDTARVVMRAPAFLRPVSLEVPDGGHEPTLALHSRATINPVVERALLAAGVDVEALAAPAVSGSGDLRVALDAIRDVATGVLEDVDVTELIVVGSFAHPGQILADDLGGGWLAENDVVAALAGDDEALAALDVPLPPETRGDRDPGAERGVGDLDPAQHRVLDAVASGLSVVVDAPPGAPTTETVAAIVADAAASGRTVIHVPGTRRAGEALRSRLDELGLPGLVLDASAGSSQGADVGELITQRLGADLPPVDATGIMRTRGELSRLNSALAARVHAWHAPRPEWGVTAHGAMQALAELTAARPAPRNQVRLSAAVLNRLTPRGLADARGELATAATLGAFQIRRSDSPWYGVELGDADEARRVVEQVQRLAVRTVPALRQRIAVATAQTGLEPATTLAVWIEQLRMLQGVRSALDVFQPQIFERSAADLVAATAPRSERSDHDELPAGVRRRLRREARDLLRPGRHVTDLHGELVAVQEQREIWRIHCPAGGWPRLPDDMSELVGVTDEVVTALAELESAIRPTYDADVPLEHVDLEALADHLLSLAEDESVSRALPERTGSMARLHDLGLTDLLADLAARRVPLNLVGAELDLAWWASVLEEILASDPALRGATTFGQDVARWRALDVEQVRSLVPPVRLATAQHLRQVALAHKDAARDLFRAADAARRGTAGLDLRTTRARYAPVTAAVVPCWSVPAMLVPQVLEQDERADLLVLADVQNLTTDQVVAAIGRARQVVLVGDVRRGGTGVVADLAEILPHVQLDTERTDRDEHLTSFLAAHGYDDAVRRVPSPPGPSLIRLDLVDGRGVAVLGGVVETVPAEVDRVVDLVVEHALSQPSESLAVVALNARHASRIRDAVAQAVAEAPAVASFFDTARPEPFAVVDIEQAAGMRRDSVILSVGFGKSPHGRVIHQFGAVSTPHGVSLLVDAIDACRGRLVVTSCIAPSELDSSRLRAAGSKMLADLLAFAEAGGDIEVETGEREGSPDPLLVDLADRLWRMGLQVVANYGPVGGVRIPLAVGHPHLAESFGVAILSDTEEYVTTPSLRVRDRHWVERLERRGWDVVVLASLDVFLDPDDAAQRILHAVSERVRAQGGDRVVAPSAAAPPSLVEEEGYDDDVVAPDAAAGAAVGVEVGGDGDGDASGTADDHDGADRADETGSSTTGRVDDEVDGGSIDDRASGGSRDEDRAVGDDRVDETGASAAGGLDDGVDGGPVDDRTAEGGSASGAAEERVDEGSLSDGDVTDDARDPAQDDTQDDDQLDEGPSRPGPATAAQIVSASDPAAEPAPAPVIPDRAWEDDDRAWGERSPDDDADRILRERPPHWG
ncbi:hypothetical protein [Litorihabitans aurantiacus]|uniref:Restriction endonuclease type II-like domain-containing protein n=1 Tax=Litorihabitans aurantiacus TaxID=1930061 RepID=A0AA37XD12_9MICO|nr:hypothetical protein [Litorihabitans aurantiacus]GMA30448.1 hypothetical protein GCM10025875_04400 [Litorihabitans aurantiacus]